MTFTQAEFDVRCEWGLQGVEQLAPTSDVVIIVDVLSFTSCVAIATAQGATIFPYRGDDAAAGFARSVNAQLAARWGSAVEHIERGFPQNVDLVSALDVSDCVPVLVDGAYCSIV